MFVRSGKRRVLTVVLGLAAALLPLRIAAEEAKVARKPEPIGVKLLTPDGKEVTDAGQINGAK